MMVCTTATHLEAKAEARADRAEDRPASREDAKHLLATVFVWQGVGVYGHCVCHSTLSIESFPAEDDDAA